ncbi:MAG: M23 family metallopeptidase [Sphingobium yanoikuyae]|nr:M23 family metallopeptidase [Sphingobium yanoikuyae]
MRSLLQSVLVTALFYAPLTAAAPPRGLLPPLSSSFGARVDPINHDTRFHRGIDIPAARGTPVVAAADGVVAFAGVRRGYGYMVEITHSDDRRTRYAHLSRLAALPGEAVDAATVIGFVGSSGRSTGPHLHFEYWIEGRAVDPLSYFEPGQAGVSQRRVGGQGVGQHLSGYARSRCHHAAPGFEGQNEIILGADVASGTARQPGCPD